MMKKQPDLPVWRISVNAQLAAFAEREPHDKTPYARLRRFHGRVRTIVSCILKNEGGRVTNSDPKNFFILFRATEETAMKVRTLLADADLGIVDECPPIKENKDAFAIPSVHHWEDTNLTAET